MRGYFFRHKMYNNKTEKNTFMDKEWKLVNKDGVYHEVHKRGAPKHWSSDL